MQEGSGCQYFSKKSEKKNNINCGLFLENLGLENDVYAEAGIIRQVRLLAKENIEKIRAKGLDVNYGDFAKVLAGGEIKVDDQIGIAG